MTEEVSIKTWVKQWNWMRSIHFSARFLISSPLKLIRSHDGDDKKRPVIIHRAILGSVERMIAILTENYGGKWFVNHLFDLSNISWFQTWMLLFYGISSWALLKIFRWLYRKQIFAQVASRMYLAWFSANPWNANCVSGLCGSHLVKWWLCLWDRPVRSTLRRWPLTTPIAVHILKSETAQTIRSGCLALNNTKLPVFYHCCTHRVLCCFSILMLTQCRTRWLIETT